MKTRNRICEQRNMEKGEKDSEKVEWKRRRKQRRGGIEELGSELRGKQVNGWMKKDEG